MEDTVLCGMPRLRGPRSQRRRDVRLGQAAVRTNGHHKPMLQLNGTTSALDSHQGLWERVRETTALVRDLHNRRRTAGVTQHYRRHVLSRTTCIDPLMARVHSVNLAQQKTGQVKHVYPEIEYNKSLLLAQIRLAAFDIIPSSKRQPRPSCIPDRAAVEHRLHLPHGLLKAEVLVHHQRQGGPARRLHHRGGILIGRRERLLHNGWHPVAHAQLDQFPVGAHLRHDVDEVGLHLAEHGFCIGEHGRDGEGCSDRLRLCAVQVADRNHADASHLCPCM
mmetsp:Transcript_42612/g.108232  ORF Transcript_42612/g.108232 Transcript_42612/m.108232 type:complete len:277 (+) Transcript_42612:192-1022(+)